MPWFCLTHVSLSHFFWFAKKGCGFAVAFIDHEFALFGGYGLKINLLILMGNAFVFI